MSPRTSTLVVATLLVASIATPAFADDTTTRPTAAPIVTEETPEQAASPAPRAAASHTEWYGWQTLAVDGVSLGTMPLELSSTSPSATYLFFASLSGYTLGAPIVHAAHGRLKVAAADLGLRVGAVAVGSLLGTAFGKPGAPSGCDTQLASCLSDHSNGLFIGATIGAVAASLIDASLLARDAHAAEAAPAPAPSFTWAPSASLLPGGGAAGLSGSF